MFFPLLYWLLLLSTKLLIFNVQGYGSYFEVTVDINGRSFSGTGKNKKDAKKNCAIHAAKSLLNIEYEEQKLEMPKEEVDKTPKLEIPEPEEEEADNPSPERRACLLACKRLPVDPTSKHPVQLLNEVFRGSEITWHINGTWVSNLYI